MEAIVFITLPVPRNTHCFENWGISLFPYWCIFNYVKLLDAFSNL